MNKKRSYNASIMNTNDTMFDLSGSVFAVVSLFMGNLYVHIRVFSNNKYPTKNGISTSASQWEALMKSINRKGTNTTSGVTIKKTTSGVKIQIEDKEQEVFINSDQVNNLTSR